MPGIDLTIKGADDLERVARRLKEVGAKDLRKDLLRGLREQGKPTIRDIRQNALRDLPKRGGLAARVAGSRFSTRNRVSGKNVGVSIVGTGKGVKNLRALNAGRLRHPVFGNRKVWAEQKVKSGWFSFPIEDDLPKIRRGMARVLEDIAHRVERSV